MVQTNTWIRSKRKRIVELAVVWCLTPLLASLTAILCCIILLIDQAKPVIQQTRIGKHGKPFAIYKLNTMGKIQTHVAGQGARDLRATRLGKILRLLIWDEIPQILINVTNGTMALVGPRPLIAPDIAAMRRDLSPPVFTQWYAAYTSCRPGWTGLFGKPSRILAIQSHSYFHTRALCDYEYTKIASYAVDIRIVFTHLSLGFTDFIHQKSRRNTVMPCRFCVDTTADSKARLEN